MQAQYSFANDYLIAYNKISLVIRREGFMAKGLNSDHQQTLYVLFGAICFSSIIFGYLVFSGMVGKNSPGPWPSINLLDEQNYGLYIAIIIATVNSILFRKNFAVENLKQKFNSINASTTPPIFKIPKQETDFKNASDSEKKEFIFRTYLLEKYILNWSLNNTITVIGLMSVVALQCPISCFYYFIVTTVVMQFIMRPKVSEIIALAQNKTLY